MTCSVSSTRRRPSGKSFAKEFAKADEATRAKLKAEHDEQDLHLRSVREQLGKVNEELQALLLLTPMIPWTGAPIGADDSANVTIKVVGRASPSSTSRSRTTWSCSRAAAGRSSPGPGR